MPLPGAAVAAAVAHEKATVVLVTHDQAEALSFADQVAVMHEGRITQVGAPADRLPGRRTTAARAASLGEACFLPGTVRAGVVTCALGALDAPHGQRSFSGPLRRPAAAGADRARRTGPGSACLAHVTKTEYFGHDALVQLRVDAPAGTSTLVCARTSGDAAPAVGSLVTVVVHGEPHILATGATGAGTAAANA